jgi:hypothetical protein
MTATACVMPETQAAIPWINADEQFGHRTLHAMAGLVPAIHGLLAGIKEERRGCPAQGRA